MRMIIKTCSRLFCARGIIQSILNLTTVDTLYNCSKQKKCEVDLRVPHPIHPTDEKHYFTTSKHELNQLVVK